MQITPYIGDVVVSAGTVVIRVNPRDRDRADDLVLSTSTITVVKDEKTYGLAREAVGQLKSMLNEIADSEKGAKRHFQAVVQTIANAAKDVGNPVAQEHSRILSLCNRYVTKLEEEEAARRKVLRKAQEQAQAQISQAQRAAAQARNQAEADKSQLALAQAKFKSETLKTAAELETDKKKLVPGGRIQHVWHFRCYDPAATLAAKSANLLRIEVDHLACLDAVKGQLVLDPNREPTLPGIEVSCETKVVIPAATKTL